ncbi:Metallo-dependent phosphatase [Panus rudis PR-1116 ss-1]|nr:Metallo-dependent phosphatase [Panus rudis PR-1116 ss-1]
MTRQWSNVPLVALLLFTGFILFFEIFSRHHNYVSLRPKKKYNFPDFNRIRHTRILPDDAVDLSTNDRIIIIGDVHGMNHSLHHLLSELDYRKEKDILIFAGDLLAKSSQAGSLSFLDFLVDHHLSNDRPRQERVLGVRGNHDQLIVQWRGWREWFENITIPAPSGSRRYKESIPTTGKEFLNMLEAEWAVERARRESDAEEWVDVARKRAQGTWQEEWWRRIPLPGKGKHKQEWRMFSDHYWLAREMSPEHASFLLSLPLILHIPSLHTFVVHGGILPFDPRLSPTDSRQPLAHLPHLANMLDNPESDFDEAETLSILRIQPDDELHPSAQLSRVGHIDEDSLRTAQESAILREVPQNTKWWNVLNLRGVRKSGKITRDGTKGTPWSRLWNDQMGRCSGFNESLSSTHKKPTGPDYSLLCRPSTVVYGHFASRGLDNKRWSKGLDTGCLYGRRLTALVLSQGSSATNSTITNIAQEEQKEDGWEDEEHVTSSRQRTKWKSARFGDDDGTVDAKLVSIKCHVVGDD